VHEAVAHAREAQEGLGLGLARPDEVGLAQQLDAGRVLLGEPGGGGRLTVEEIAALLTVAKAPGLDGLGQLSEVVGVLEIDA
jgi:hypothetical protein